MWSQHGRTTSRLFDCLRLLPRPAASVFHAARSPPNVELRSDRNRTRGIDICRSRIANFKTTRSRMASKRRRCDAHRSMFDRRQLGAIDRCGLPVLPAVQARAVIIPSHGRFVGASSLTLSEYRRRPGDRVGLNWRIPNVHGKRAIRHVVYDTNWWKSFINARLRVSMGDRGCLSLFGTNAETHRMFAEHLTSEYFIKTEARAGALVSGSTAGAARQPLVRLFGGFWGRGTYAGLRSSWFRRHYGI